MISKIDLLTNYNKERDLNWLTFAFVFLTKPRTVRAAKDARTFTNAVCIFAFVHCSNRNANFIFAANSLQ